MPKVREQCSSALRHRLHLPGSLVPNARRGRGRESRAALLVCAVLASLGGACKKSSGTAQAIGGVGRSLATASATDLRLTPDRQVATYLTQGEKPRLEGVPDPMVVGALNAVWLQGGTPRKLGNGVTNLPGGYLFSGDSSWVVFLTGSND